MKCSFYTNFLVLLIGMIHLPYSHSLGINCKGSSYCEASRIGVEYRNAVQAYFDVAAYGNRGPYVPGGPIANGTIYYKGDHIICVKNHEEGSLCLFLQRNVPAEGVNGAIIIKKLSELYFHGCKFCGSVPISDDNDPNKMGILTINYVLRKGCQGLCKLRNGGNATATTPSEVVVLDADEATIPSTLPQQGVLEGT